MNISKINAGNSPRLNKKGSVSKNQNVNNTKLNINNNKVNSTPAFKGLGGLDSFCLGLADLIENGGLFVSFTLQDMLGTNLPRPIMGLKRNSKENSGKANKSFAAKELVREMLTGPSMFLIPMAMLAIGRPIFGKNIEVPMKFIQDFGDIHAKAPLNEAGNAISKTEFYANTFAKMIKNAKGENEIGEATKATAKEWADSLGELTDKKAIKEKIGELADKFTTIAKESAVDPKYKDFTSVTLDKASGSFSEATEFMTSYADRTIKNAKDYIKTNGADKATAYIKKMADKSTLKRLGTNAAMFAAVLGFLQVIPKLYNKAEGEKNAGLTGLMKEETLNSTTPAKTDEKKETTKTDNAQQPTFKGGMGDIAKSVTSGKVGKMFGGLEFQGYNLSLPLLLGVMGLGVLMPRVIQAKDKYDREEILRRDLVTCAVMAFGEKILCKAFSKMNEANSGFVLTQKAKDFDTQSLGKKVLDYIRPQKGVSILSSEKIVAKYANIDQYKDGIAGFAKSISDEGGNLAKIFGIDNKAKTLVEKMLGEGKKLADADNTSIIEALKKAKGSDAENALVEMFKQGKTKKEVFDFKNILKNKGLKKINIEKVIDNPWVKKAKTLNSRFTALSVLVLVPVFLGFMLPAINERATKKRIREEQAAAEAQKTSAINNQNFMPKAPKVFDEINPFIQK